jgi:transposase
MDIENQRLLVYNALLKSQTKLELQKILCVWMKLSLELNAKQIALSIGWTAGRVRKMQSRFSRDGIQGFYKKPRGGRKREYLSLDRERQILDKFARRAKRGFSLDFSAIREAYELSVGRPVSRSTIYRLIERHDLRKYLPRARFNPKRNAQ